MDNDNINSSIPDTGDYRVASFTGYMIACTVYLPIVSWIIRIIFYSPLFYDTYSAIHQLNTGICHVPSEDLWKGNTPAVLLFVLLLCFAAVFLMVPFIAFMMGIYLSDYDSSEYEVPSSAIIAMQELAKYLYFCFMLSNLEAFFSPVIPILIIFGAIIILLLLVLLSPCILVSFCVNAVVSCTNKHIT